jgi:hypothetical protein
MRLKRGNTITHGHSSIHADKSEQGILPMHMGVSEKSDKKIRGLLRKASEPYIGKHHPAWFWWIMGWP